MNNICGNEAQCRMSLWAQIRKKVRTFASKLVLTVEELKESHENHANIYKFSGI